MAASNLFLDKSCRDNGHRVSALLSGYSDRDGWRAAPSYWFLTPTPTAQIVLLVVIAAMKVDWTQAYVSKQRAATNGHTRTWSAASLGVAYCGVDLVNDIDTTMVVDSVMVVPNGER